MPAPKRGGAFSKIHSYVEDGSFEDSDHLPLGVGRFLKVKTPHGPSSGAAHVVLRVGRGKPRAGKSGLRKTFKKEAARIAEHAGLD